MKKASVVAVVLVGMLLPMASAWALTEAEAVAAVKAQIGPFKKNLNGAIARETSDLEGDLNDLLERLRSGASTPAGAASELPIRLRDTIFEIHRQHLNLVPIRLTDALSTGLAELGQDTLPGFASGDGGTFDKLQLATEATLLKGRKTIAGLVKKFGKGFRQATGGTQALTVVLPPFPIGRLPVVTQTTIVEQKFPVALLVIVAVRDLAAGTGEIHVGGSADDGTVQVITTGSVSRSNKAVVGISKLWATSFTGIEPGAYEVTVREEGDLVPAVVQAIGAP